MAELDGSTEEAARFNGLATEEARTVLVHCLEAPSWAEIVLAGRPYASTKDLICAAENAAEAMDDVALTSALAGHPRIGERPAGTTTSEVFSRAEQSGVDPEDQDVARRLRAGNLAYEDRFGHVFLICASGRTAPEILDALTDRLTHDDDTERAVVKEQLGQIAVLRLHHQLAALATAPGTGVEPGGPAPEPWDPAPGGLAGEAEA
jgi:2-oxo-4-hydroxy-4-carboxy-5-ureidoimidazoline decarboxylase